MEKELDHPCKGTCSGWSMGYLKGAKASKEDLESIISDFNKKLLKQHKLMKEVLEHISKTNMPELGDYG